MQCLSLKKVMVGKNRKFLSIYRVKKDLGRRSAFLVEHEARPQRIPQMGMSSGEKRSRPLAAKTCQHLGKGSWQSE